MASVFILVYTVNQQTPLYLQATSCHEKTTINIVPKGVALRLRRICSNNNNYQKKASEYTNHLVKHGYN